MTNLDQDTLENLKKLCRIECTPAEQQDLLHSIKRILDYIEQLNEVDTEGVLPCNHVLQMMLKNITRPDEVKECLSREVFLANAPDQIGGMIRVPSILKESP